MRHTRTREESADRELALGMICHDLKNQSVAISIGAQLLRRQLSKDSWDRANLLTQVSAMEDNAAFMGRMVDAIYIQRFAHGTVTLNLSSLNLCLLLQDTVKLFSPVVRSIVLRLTHQYMPKPPLGVGGP